MVTRRIKKEGVDKIIRITYPGAWEDFNTIKQAVKFAEKKLNDGCKNLTMREFKKENILIENGQMSWK